MSSDTARVVLSTVVTYRGRSITVECEGLDADRFCDMLDKRFGETQSTQQSSDAPPTCANRNCTNHGKPMAPSQHGGWFCRGKDPTTGNSKGYCKSAS